MAFLDIFRRKKNKKTSQRNFTGANAGRLFNDWKASSSSPDAELENNLKVLRDRCRDLARNNPIVQRYFQLIKQGVVGNGQGFKIQVHSRNDDGTLDDYDNDLIERSWYKWCQNPEVSNTYTMPDIYGMIVEGLARDGEVLCHFINTKEGLKLSFLEPDYLDSNLNKELGNGRCIKMGVEIDKYTQEPIAYWINRDPYSSTVVANYSNPSKEDRIDASEMLHIYNPDRFGQTRGYPKKLSSTMTAIKWLQDFRLSELVASKAAASKMAFIKTPAGDSMTTEAYLDGEAATMPAMNFEPATIDILPQGTDIEFANWNHPNTGVGEFDKAMLRTIASGLGVSYASLSNDLTQTSYSSARVGLLDERDSYKQSQSFIVEHFCKPVYRKWLEMAIISGTLPLPMTRYEKWANPVEFSARGYHSVDPLKEAQANQLNLTNGLSTIQDVLNQSGKELSQHFSELDAQAGLASKMGIDLAYEPYGTKFNAQTGVPFDENNEDNTND